jgi:hypothetical protein
MCNNMGRQIICDWRGVAGEGEPGEKGEIREGGEETKPDPNERLDPMDRDRFIPRGPLRTAALGVPADGLADDVPDHETRVEKHHDRGDEGGEKRLDEGAGGGVEKSTEGSATRAVESEINVRAGLATEAENRARLQGLSAAHVLDRIGTPQEIAEAFEYLARAEWTTGWVLTVDGGLGLGVTNA